MSILARQREIFEEKLEKLINKEIKEYSDQIVEEEIEKTCDNIRKKVIEKCGNIGMRVFRASFDYSKAENLIVNIEINRRDLPK